MTRNEIATISLQKLKEVNYNGTLVLEPGSGKSKIAIDCIKQGNFKNVLITSPRTNLKESWWKELDKWGYKYFPGQRRPTYGFGLENNDPYFEGTAMSYNNKTFTRFEIQNVQTSYRWNKKQLNQFDFIIYDEVHTCGEEYFNLVKTARELNIPVLGLTGTPTLSDSWKKEVLYKTLPIVYEYYSAENDGITNKIQYWVYEYNLTNDYKVLTGTKTKKWWIGELKQYEYLSEQYDKAKSLMYAQGADNYFEQALDWMNSKTCTKEQKEAGKKFFYAIRNRKEFLWNLTSSKTLALLIKNKILQFIPGIYNNSPSTLSKFDNTNNNKVLLFSELTQQAEKLSSYSIHSNNGKNAKEAETINKDLLDRFNKGELRELSSCLSLTLGLNMVGASHAIFESYSSSKTNFIQKSKRLARLDRDKIAHVIVIVPKGTQSANWANELLKGLNYITITDLKDLKI